MLVCNVSEYISHLRSAKREREMIDEDASSQNEVQMQEVWMRDWAKFCRAFMAKEACLEVMLEELGTVQMEQKMHCQ